MNKNLHIPQGYRQTEVGVIPGHLVGSLLLIFLVFIVVSYYMSLRSEFRVVMSITISA